MQISIQSVEITYNKVPYRFIVKKVFNSSNEISFHCWAPEDSFQTKALIENEVLLFEWDKHRLELRAKRDSPVSEYLREAIKESFSMERA